MAGMETSARREVPAILIHDVHDVHDHSDARVFQIKYGRTRYDR